MLRLLVICATLVSSFIIYSCSNDDSTDVIQPAPTPFDTRLLSCNKVFSAQPSDDFDVCLTVAKDGDISAQKRILWAYSRQGEYQDWQEVFNWTKAIQWFDRRALTLSFVLMQLMGDSNELSLRGEKGLKQLANNNEPSASVILASTYALEENTLPQSSNYMWLLERAYKQSPEVLSPTDMALVYARGFGRNPNLEKARKVLDETAQRYFPKWNQ